MSAIIQPYKSTLLDYLYCFLVDGFSKGLLSTLIRLPKRFVELEFDKNITVEYDGDFYADENIEHAMEGCRLIKSSINGKTVYGFQWIKFYKGRQRYCRFSCGYLISPDLKLAEILRTKKTIVPSFTLMPFNTFQPEKV